MENLQDVAYKVVRDLAHEAWRMGIVLKDHENTRSKRLNAFVWSLATLLDAEDEKAERREEKGIGTVYNLKVEIRLREAMDPEDLMETVEWNLAEDLEHVFVNTSLGDGNSLLGVTVRAIKKQ